MSPRLPFSVAAIGVAGVDQPPRHIKPFAVAADELTEGRSHSRISTVSHKMPALPLTQLSNKLVFPCLAALLILGAGQATSESPPDQWIMVKTPKGATIQAELADTVQKRAQGLMYRYALARDRGMLFTFGDSQRWGIWMKNTRIPLDILWLDEKKVIVHIERNVPICTRADDGCPAYTPNRNAAYVLEVAAGVADELALTQSVTLHFVLPGP